MYWYRNVYSGPCILRPAIPARKCGLKLKVVFKQRDNTGIYIENATMVPLKAGLKIE